MKCEIVIPSAFFLEYREDDRVMEVEMDFRDESPILSHRAVRKWKPPHDAEVLTDSERRQVMMKIIDYLHRERGFKFEVDGGSLVESRSYPDR